MHLTTCKPSGSAARLLMRVFKPLLLTFCIAIVIDAQSQQHEIKITPPAPEATSIFKFQEVPVSTYTGLANTSVPLYTINLKRMSIPINVSYHARGVKVDEIASRVGTGWALNYGGMVSRQIRGKADDSGLGYLYSDYYNEVFTAVNQQEYMMTDIINGELDEYPDLFFFDMVGQGGKFTFDQVSQGVVQQKFSDNKITPIFATEGQIDGWIIVDPEGNTFYFGFSEDRTRKAVDYEQVPESYVFKRSTGNLTVIASDNERSITSWHLMEIKTSLGERVNFIYESPSEEEVTISYRHSYDKQDGSDVMSNFSKTISHQPQLEEIIFDNGKVVFTKLSADREDIDGGHVLDKVQILDKQNSTVKEYTFQYYYTTSPNDGNQLTYLKTIEPKSSKRLFLQSIQEKGKSGKTIPPYYFEYNPLAMPNRFSTSQDNWGYYNGKNNGEYLTFFNYTTTPVSREVDVEKSEAGILKKLIYPTGGYVLFEYEHNVAIPPAFLAELLIPENNPTPTQHRLEGFLKHPSYYVEDSDGIGMYVDSFKVGEMIGTANFSFQIFKNSGSEEPADCRCEVILSNDNNAEDLYLYPPETNRTISLDTGTYTLKVVLMDNTNSGDNFSVKLVWDEYKPAETPDDSVEQAPMLTAGKRIKKITYVNADKTVLTKEYSYIKPSGITSGKIFGLPNFYSIQETAGNWPITDKYGSMPGSPLTSLQGNSVGYSHVTEYVVDSNNNSLGRTEYEFTITEDGGQYYKFPFHLPIDNEWLRGKNLVTRIFENNDLKKVTENSYLYSGKLLPADFLFKPADLYKYSITDSISYIPLLVFTAYAPEPGTGYVFNTYYVMGGTCDLNTSKETYYDGNTPTFSQVKKYYYNYNHHYQIKGVETTGSDNTHTYTYTTYASDYATGTPFIDAMKTKNILAYPIEEVTYRDNQGVQSILSGKVTYYKTTFPAIHESIHLLELSKPILLSGFKFTNAVAGQLPSNGTQLSFIPFAGYKSKVEFNSYDVKGNLLQMTTDGAYVTSYIWDYTNTTATTRVNGAAQSDIACTSFEADGTGNWIFSGTTVTDETSPTGTKAYNLSGGAVGKTGLNNLKKYILTYWVKSTSSISIATSAGGTVSLHSAVTSVNGWTQFRCELNNTTLVSVSGSVMLDEVRLHPAEAEMTSFCYEPLVGMTSSSDVNGKITYYKYDLLSRLQAIKDQQGNVLKFFQYHYSQQP
jgi:YD repeat-containing protein